MKMTMPGNIIEKSQGKVKLSSQTILDHLRGVTAISEYAPGRLQSKSSMKTDNVLLYMLFILF